MRALLSGVVAVAMCVAMGCNSTKSTPELETITIEVVPMADSSCYIHQAVVDKDSRESHEIYWWYISGTTRQRVTMPVKYLEMVPLADGSAMAHSADRMWRLKGVLVEEIKVGLVESPRSSSLSTKASYYFALLQQEKAKRKQDADDYEQKIEDITTPEDDRYDRW